MGLKTHSANESGEEVGPFSSPVNQSGHDFWASGSDHQAGVASPGPKVNHGSGSFGEGGNKGQRMVNHLIQRSIPQHADALGIAQRIQQLLSIVWAQRGNH